MTLYRHALGYAIRTERLRQNLTMRDVSSRAPMALGYLSEVELGKKDISSELLESLANSLGLSLGTLIERVAVVLIDTEQQTEMRIEKEMTITN